jgi:hypothetical protein
MSALRYSVPGQPTRLVDVGPATGRISHTRYGIKGSVGDAMISPIKRGDGSDVPPALKARRAAAHARYKERHG